MSSRTLPARHALMPVLAALVLVSAGCAAGPQARPVAASTASTGSSAYPNLNVPLVPATAQITPQERVDNAQGLAARREGLAASAAAAPPSSAPQLRELGATHAQGAIERIERTQ